MRCLRDGPVCDCYLFNLDTVWIGHYACIPFAHRRAAHVVRPKLLPVSEGLRVRVLPDLLYVLVHVEFITLLLDLLLGANLYIW